MRRSALSLVPALLLTGLVSCSRPAAPNAPGPDGEPPTSATNAPASAETTEPPAAAPVAAGHPGCFMLLDLAEGEPRSGGAQPCDARTIPASTFKVPHALIALDTGVVTDPDATVPWDGRKRWLDSWNRDHSLRSAIYHSAVWFFQGTARAIGQARMQDYLQAFDYGNALVQDPIDAFWLDGGSLRISPEETLRFWADLYRDRLPRGAEHVSLLRDMVVRPPSSFRGRLPEGTAVPEVHPQMVFSAKTGTGAHEDGSVTWIAGHVQCPEHAYVFVSRVIAPEPPSPRSPAVEHGLAALDGAGVLRCATP